MKSDRSKHWILIAILVLVAGAAWVWVSKASPGSTTGGGIPAPHEGFLAPDFSLQTSTGETLTFSALRGQPLIVNLWASWCAPCRAEMPAFERVFNQYKDQGFLILAVNVTSQDDPTNAAAFAEEFGLTFPILFDTQGEVSHLYQSSALPTSYFIDKEGIIQEVVVGGPMSEALLRIRVEELLNTE
jgi:peroxiredoxin